MRQQLVWRALGLVVLLGAQPADAQTGGAPSGGAQVDDGSAEIGLWKAIQNSKDPSDYRGYLLLFPNGRFAPLARLRAGGKLNGEPDAMYRLEVTPATTLAGYPVQLKCVGFLSPALFDWIVVVPAGTADFDPGSRDPGQPRPLFARLAPTVDCGGAGLSLPAQAPGAYEARYVSRAYNSEGKSEVVARVSYFVR